MKLSFSAHCELRTVYLNYNVSTLQRFILNLTPKT
jgi:hypothetical protein